MRRVIGVFLLATLVLVTAGADADAKRRKRRRPPMPITCPMLVTESIRAGNDLECDGDGLIVSAPNITIDLNGHTIDGTAGDHNTGIVNTGGFDGLKIKRGTITGFEVGLYANQMDDSRIAKLQVTDSSEYGIYVEGSTGNGFKKNRVTGSGHLGIAISEGSDGNVLKKNVAMANGMASTDPGTGILIDDSDGNRLKRNTASENGDLGIAVSDGSTGNVLKGNRTHANGGNDSTMDPVGIYVENNSNDNVLKANKAVSNGNVGIFVDGTSGNTLKANKTRGGLAGIALARSTDTIMKDNVASGHEIYGIALLVNSTGNMVTRNAASANGVAGIVTDGDSTGNSIVKNRANRNGAAGLDGVDDGIHTLTSGNVISRNTTNRNTDLGIESPFGTQGSKNRARKNGNPAQCSPATLC